MDNERAEFIIDLLRNEYGREVEVIHGLGRDSNNFVYRLTIFKAISPPTNPTLSKVPRPGTVGLFAEDSQVVIRISNPQAMVNADVRVQNEVAAMCLMRQALSSYRVRLIPNIYAWCPSSRGRGWILQEYMRGTQLDQNFRGLDPKLRRDLLRQIAEVFKLIQSFRLPDSVDGYDGLRFNKSSDIVTGPTTIPCGGPFSDYHEMYTQMLRRQLLEPDTSERIAGWRRNGLRDRLERFASCGITEQIIANCIPRQTLVHGDFNTFNILYDERSNCLTGLLDFEFSHVATPADEYFYSFRTVDALLAGPFEPGDEGKLRKCLLDGFDGDVPSECDGRVDWEAAVMIDKEFTCAGVLRPADIKRIWWRIS